MTEDVFLAHGYVVQRYIHWVFAHLERCLGNLDTQITNKQIKPRINKSTCTQTSR